MCEAVLQSIGSPPLIAAVLFRGLFFLEQWTGPTKDVEGDVPIPCGGAVHVLKGSACGEFRESVLRVVSSCIR